MGVIGYRSIVVMAVLALPAAAAAQVRDADPVYERANRLRRRHHDARALSMLRAHWEATHQPRALASMGLAEMALRAWPDAERHIVEALALPPSPWVDANRAALETALQQVRAQLGVGALLVRSQPAGAEVFVNGSRVGAAGQPIRVSVGALSFEVRAPDRVAVNRSVTVAPGMTVTEEVALAPVTPPTPPAAPAPVVTSAPPVANPTILVSVAPAQPAAATPVDDGSERSTSTLRALGWAGAAGAAVFIGLGAGTYVVGANAAERYNGEVCLVADRDRGDVCANDLSTARTMGVIATLGFVTGGVLAIASGVLFGVSGSSRRDRRAALRCGVGMGPSFGCGGEF